MDTVEALFTSGIISMAADACRIVSIMGVIAVKNTDVYKRQDEGQHHGDGDEEGQTEADELAHHVPLFCAVQVTEPVSYTHLPAKAVR